MNLADQDEIVGMQLDHQGETLLIASERGMGKRTKLEEFTVQKRGGKGVKCYKITEKTGYVVGVKAVNDDHEILMITNAGIIIQIPMSDVSILGRITSGVKLINLEKDVVVAKIATVREKITNGYEELSEDDLDTVEEPEQEVRPFDSEPEDDIQAMDTEQTYRDGSLMNECWNPRKEDI